MLAARPYARKLTELLEQLARARRRGRVIRSSRCARCKRRLVVVITSDKGLCGAYNMNILSWPRRRWTRRWPRASRPSSTPSARRPATIFRKRGYTVFAAHDDFGGEATAERGQRVGDRMVNGLPRRHVRRGARWSTPQFVSTMRQVPVDRLLLPIAPRERPRRRRPSAARARLHLGAGPGGRSSTVLLPLYLRNRVFMTLMEAFTSEHAARMTSMTAATENAGELIDALTLQRNRERQAAITAELLDIVGGANAL